MKTVLAKTSFFLLLLPLGIVAQKKQVLAEEELKTWHFMDFEQDTIPGISLERAYRELLRNKKGQEVIVAVLDTKIDMNHEDIKDQLWVNTDEIPDNRIDDDKNGYVDDINGWNFLGNSNGEDVVIQQAESTRIVKRYGSKFESVPKEKIRAEERETYELYLRAKKIYEHDLAETKSDIKYFDSVAVVFKRARDTVEQLLGKAAHTSTGVDSLAKLHPKLEDDLNYYARALKYSITEDLYQKNIDRSTKYLTTMYSLDYDDRILLKDDPQSLSDVPYGNNILINNALDFQHSTPVSGLMAATRDNGVGVDGISNTIKIMPVVMVAEGDEHDKEIALAIRYAVDNGADIINMSWGKYLSMHVEWVRDAFRYAEEHDVLLVSASGNSGKNVDEEITYPNDDIDGVEFVDNFIMAGGHTRAVDSTLVAWFSNYGKNSVDIFAPAHDIYAPEIENGYGTTRGTSFASPLVAGVAALLKSYYPNLTAKQLKKIILESGTPLDIDVKIRNGENTEMVPFSELSKTGKILNAHNALKMAQNYSSESLYRIKQKD